MGLRELAEGIILQSMEDLWDKDLREESIAFFRSSEFDLCARMAEINIAGQVKLLKMVQGALRHDGRMEVFPEEGERPRPGREKRRRETVASCI